MNWPQFVLSQLVKVALVGCLLGVAVRGRYRQCLAFPVYLAAVLACDSLVSLWPARFFVTWFWILQHALWNIARLGVALELAFRFFRAFPGGQASARLPLLLVLALTTGAAISLPAGITYEAVALDWQPRVLTGTIWLMTGLGLLVVWFRLPIHAFQKAILIGFVPYLVVFVSLLDVVKAHGWKERPWVNLADASAYLVVSGWWAVAAWRKDRPEGASPAVLARLGLEPA